MRAFWSGDMSFGLVTIPVKLYTATKDLSPQFKQLHKECSTPINMVRRCNKCAKDVPWEEIGKGYEVSKDTFALFTKEELAKLEGDGEDKGTIEIVQFFDPDEIDPAYLDTSYWIGPGGKTPKTARGYELLRQVLDNEQRYALVRIKLRTRPRLAIVEPKGNLFQLHTLRFSDELIPASELAGPDVKNISDRELEMARGLVESLTGTYDAEKNVDTYRAAVLAAADQKMAGGDTATGTPAPEATASNVVDLADLLAASIKSAPKPDKDAKPKRGKKAKAS